MLIPTYCHKKHISQCWRNNQLYFLSNSWIYLQTAVSKKWCFLIFSACRQTSSWSFIFVFFVALETIICTTVRDSWLKPTSSWLNPLISALVKKRSFFGIDSFSYFKFNTPEKQLSSWKSYPLNTLWISGLEDLDCWNSGSFFSIFLWHFCCVQQ